MSLVRLASDVRLDLVYEDETPFGSALGGGADRAIRAACTEIFPPQGDMNDVVRRSKELLHRAFERDLASRFVRPEVLREECLYPPAARVKPHAIVVTREDQTLLSIGVDPAAHGELAKWFSDFQRGTKRPTGVVGQALYDLLLDAGAMTATEAARAPNDDLTFVGHATALLGGEDRILVDPFLLPTSPRYGAYQPLGPAELAPNAILVTHSHPDHFDPGSLLRLGAETPIYVPHVERESLLAVDMALRLEQLGFSRVKRIRPGDVLTIGQTTVHVLPFFGEQPTTGDCLHPEVRNAGCTYSVVSPKGHTLLLADSGRDREGDVRDLAADVRRRWSAPDTLLSGYRGFAVYPIQWLFSSVARYLLFVPEPERAVRQVTMNDSDALIDTAERCAAKRVVPYADGGAPWYWERGLGPRLDGEGIVNASADPPPEEVIRRAAQRSTWGEEPLGSSVAVKILRPGEPVHAWPFRTHRWHQHNVALARVDGDAMPSARAVFHALAAKLDAWRNAGRLECFFFMRKAPDLRLRFFGDEALGDEIAALLGELAIERTFTSTYEPEIARFGGPAAMRAVHTWFDADTKAWMNLESTSIDKELLAAAVADDLVARVIDDSSEIWALWRSYASSFGLSRDDDAPLFSADLDALTTDENRAWLAQYRESNRVLARDLGELASRGELETGLRGVLIGVVMFHLNRYGFTVEEHTRLVWKMIRSRDPALGRKHP